MQNFRLIFEAKTDLNCPSYTFLREEDKEQALTTDIIDLIAQDRNDALVTALREIKACGRMIRTYICEGTEWDMKPIKEVF
jgi:hypothetical protein